MTNPKDFQDPATSAIAAMKAYQELFAVSAARTALDSNSLSVAHGLDAALQASRALQESVPAGFLREARELAKRLGSAGAATQFAESAAAFRHAQEALRPDLASARALGEVPSAALEPLASLRLPETLEGLTRLKAIPDSVVLRVFQESPSLAAASRMRQWADQLTGSATELSALMSGSVSEIGRVQRAAGALSALAPAPDSDHWASRNGVRASVGIDLGATRLKLSALAAAGDVLGVAARPSSSTYEQLFGDWYTRPDLPQRFWREPRVRHRHYQEADVDRGLIEATPAAAVELVVQSGLAAGLAADPSPVAFLSVADVTLMIRASNVRGDTYKIITAFEEELRRFITAKLQERAGPRWFKQRVDGKLFAKAKEGRSVALANGEKDPDLLAYLDLGDLLQIITRRDNWDQVFGRVFPNRPRLEHDLQALIAVRRPTMHARSLDAVRLIEMMCVIGRLTRWIEENGQWRRTAEADD